MYNSISIVIFQLQLENAGDVWGTVNPMALFSTSPTATSLKAPSPSMVGCVISLWARLSGDQQLWLLLECPMA